MAIAILFISIGALFKPALFQARIGIVEIFGSVVPSEHCHAECAQSNVDHSSCCGECGAAVSEGPGLGGRQLIAASETGRECCALDCISHCPAANPVVPNDTLKSGDKNYDWWGILLSGFFQQRVLFSCVYARFADPSLSATPYPATQDRGSGRPGVKN